MYAIVESNTVTKTIAYPKSLTIGDVQYPSKIFSLWSEAELKVQVDMPDRVVSANNQVSSSGVKAISFSPIMKTTSYALGLAIDNMASGDYYTITSKTASGFQVNFFNSSNSAIDRQFDFIARGY